VCGNGVVSPDNILLYEGEILHGYFWLLRVAFLILHITSSGNSGRK
jgi:hypothetical protein